MNGVMRKWASEGSKSVPQVLADHGGKQSPAGRSLAAQPDQETFISVPRHRQMTCKPLAPGMGTQVASAQKLNPHLIKGVRKYCLLPPRKGDGMFQIQGD